MSVHRLLVPLNVTYSRFVRTIERKCGIDPSVFVTRIACMDAGRREMPRKKMMCQHFMSMTIVRCVVVAMVGGDANTGGDANVVGTEEPQEEEDIEGDEEVEEEEEEEEDLFLDFDNYVFDTSTLDDEETRREEYFVRSFPGNDDFHYMPPFLRTEDVVMTPNQPIPYNRRGRVKAEQVFRSKPQMTLALGMKFLEEGFEFKTIRSGKHIYEAVCVHDNCGWRIYATYIGSSEMFQVRKLNDVHTCSTTQMHLAHRQATRRVLSHLLLGDISRTIRGCDIVRYIKARYKIDISYWQAWRAKWRAICMIEGNPVESFTRLPQYFYNVELKNPDTVTDITTDVTERFASCFFALGCAIATFRSQLLRGLFGYNVLAVAMDANNQVVPIAIRVAKSESGDWRVVYLLFPNAEKVYQGNGRSGPLRQAINTCTQRRIMHIAAKDAGVKFNKKIFWKTCKAYTRYEFDLNMSALRAAIPSAELLDRVNPNRWSRAHFPGVRYNIMTSNSVECMNAHSHFFEKAQLLALLNTFVLFNKNALQTNTLTPWAKVRVQMRAVEFASWIVRDIGYGRVQRHQSPVLQQNCSCNIWQLSGLPCGHAIVVAAMQNLIDCSHLASPYFTVKNLKATWASLVYPVGPQLA
ncbi:hypothetical protein OSB04_016845 [Centaurea solstitialis]|uniref:SWIM-type domain-containing protein n=1 Tax=Centaurea solstitialis TaxID=347529 RepID=A0AA38WHU8_9ASTR|nr:hypothetical protein OSB04_016845 [Centaurea solstitialis]